MEPAPAAAEDHARSAGECRVQSAARRRGGRLSRGCRAGMAGALARQSKGTGKGTLDMTFLLCPPDKGGGAKRRGVCGLQNETPRSPRICGGHDPLVRGIIYLTPCPFRRM